MKKKIALFLAAAMTVSALPMTAFASTTNTVSKIATVETDDKYESTIVLDEFKGMTTTDEKQTIKLTLLNSRMHSSQILLTLTALHGQRSVTRKLSQHSQLLTTTQIQLNSLSRLQLKTKVTQQLQSKLQMQ